jgi:parallel beta-helix repeat protein
LGCWERFQPLISSGRASLHYSSLFVKHILFMRTDTTPVFFILAFVFLVLGAGVPADTLAQSTYIVDDLSDASDAAVGDGACATSSGTCTLRAALEEADANETGDVIEFASDLPTNADGLSVISVQSELDVSSTVEIRGRTAPGYSDGGAPVIVLDGSSTSGAVDGLEVGASNVVIEALTIVGFPDDGIDIRGGDGTRVSFCYIGVESDGNIRNENGDHGIAVVSGQGHIIGSDGSTGGGNVISGNGGNGITLSGGSPQARIGGNTIGMNAAGTQAIGNSTYGISVIKGTGSEIGYVDASGIARGNVISGNSGAGVFISSGGHSVLANTIGLSPDEATVIPNDTGILLASSGITVGPMVRGSTSNVIGGHSGEAIQIGNSTQRADGNVIRNNLIGLNRSGADTGNGTGIRVELGSDNTIEGNTVGYNDRGIVVSGGNLRNQILANRVGLSTDGAPTPNQSVGIAVQADVTEDTDANVVGGRDAADANTVAFNAGPGISIEGSNNNVIGNYVGTDENGTDIGNSGPGIRVTADGVQVGEPGAGNVVGFNGGGGIRIENASSTQVAGNYIGALSGGSAVGNDGAGIEVTATSGNSATGTVLGYAFGETVPDNPVPSGGGAGNVVANNGGDGIVIAGSGTVTGNAVRGNAVFGNATRGIDLGTDGQTANDPSDADTGPNNLQNTPEFDEAETRVLSGGDVQIRYRVDCDPANCDYGNSGLRVDIYRTPGDGTSQGQRFLGSTLYASGDAGTFVTQTITPPGGVTVQPTDQIVGVVTDAAGNSSEFSSVPTVLPVEFVSFRGIALDNAAKLEWTTATEQNNAGFQVQRKVDGSFQNIDGAFVEGAGTSEEPQSYSYRVEDLDAGQHTFRLKQVDVDGGSSFSKETTVKVGLDSQYELKAYPNPISEQATIKFAVKESQDVTLELYNTLGQRVQVLHQGSVPSSQTRTVSLQASDLSSGLYIVRMRGESFSTTKSVTVVR